jgi:hypothetical protein
MGSSALDIGNKADAAGVMLVAGVIKTLFRRQTHLNPNRTFQAHFPCPLTESQGNAQFLELPGM